MYTVKWSVMQYVIVRPGAPAPPAVASLRALTRPRPAVSMVGIITEALGVLCPQSYSPQFAQVYITAIDFVSIRCAAWIGHVVRVLTDHLWCSVALYGLILFYDLTKHELEGRRPLAKFLCIKGACVARWDDGVWLLTVRPCRNCQ